MVRRRYILLAFFVLVLGLGIWAFRVEQGPIYENRRARDWLPELMQSDPERKAQAGRAFAEMGVDAAPFLAAAMGRKKYLVHLARDWIAAHWWGTAVDRTEEYKWRAAAVHAVSALGTNGSILLPDLLRTYYDFSLSPHSLGYETAFLEIGPVSVSAIAHGILTHNSLTNVDQSILLLSVERIMERHGVEASWSSNLTDALALVMTSPHDNLEAAVACDIARRGGAASAPLVRPMLGLLANPDHRARYSSVYALGQLGLEPDLCVPALVPCLRDPHASVRGGAAQSLALLGPAAYPAIPDMAAGLKDSYTSVVTAVLNALAKFGNHAALAVPPVVEVLAHPEPIVRSLAIRTLVAIQNDPATVLPHLTAALEDDEAEVRRYAAENLGRLGPAAAPALEALVQALLDPRESVQVTAVEALGRMGELAKPALPRLMLAWNNNQSALGPYVRKAFERIEGKEFPYAEP